MATDNTPGQGTAAFPLLHPDQCLPGWRTLLRNDDEHAVVARYGKSKGPGHRYALLLIDFQLAYLGRDEPIGAQLEDAPTASGSTGWAAFGQALRLLDAARAAGIPVYATRVAYSPATESDVTFGGKRDGAPSFAVGAPGVELPDALRLRPNEVLANKRAASAFHGTSLDKFLDVYGIDGLLVTGLSTSGCVRATVVDAAARGLRPIVVVDAVGDRLHISHQVALLDIWMKYGDLCSAADAAAYLLAHAPHGDR